MLERAIVTAQDPDGYHVFVSLLGQYGGQGPVLSVDVGTHGPRDGVTGQHPELPTPGTCGIVAFTSGDNRNGVWVCSTRNQLIDAAAQAPGLGGIAYGAHYGGGWSQRSQDGSLTEWMPDGTMIQVGPTVPQPTRHTLDQNQARQRTPFTPSERVANPPASFPITVNHSSGASIALSASGAWTVKAAPGQSMVLMVNNAMITIDTAGNVSLNSQGDVMLTASAEVAIKAPLIVASNGGLAQAVQLADNSNSIVFRAQ